MSVFFAVIAHIGVAPLQTLGLGGWGGAERGGARSVVDRQPVRSPSVAGGRNSTYSSRVNPFSPKRECGAISG